MAVGRRYAIGKNAEILLTKAKKSADEIVQKAQAEAEAMVMLAQAQAEANKLLAESLTGNLLEKMYYEKWDGKLPYIYGGDNTPIIQMP